MELCADERGTGLRGWMSGWSRESGAGTGTGAQGVRRGGELERRKGSFIKICLVSYRALF